MTGDRNLLLGLAGAAAVGAYAIRRGLHRDAASPPRPMHGLLSGHGPMRVSNERRRPRCNRVTISTTDASKTVQQSPAELLQVARRRYPKLSLDEYTAARLAASEHFRGSFAELCAIIDAELNRALARHRSLFEHLTWRGTFGRQGRHRVASTRLDPWDIHVAAALGVLRTGAQRGISHGAVRFFDPRTQLWGALRGKWCHPLVVLERWSFDLPWLRVGGKRKRCTLDRSKPGPSPQAWVGEIEGIDSLDLMLMRAASLGDDHQRRYEAARTLIQTRLLGTTPTTT